MIRFDFSVLKWCVLVHFELYFTARSLGGGDTPDFGHAFSNRSYFRACDRLRLSSVQRARRLGGENKKKERKNKEEERIRGKTCPPTGMRAA